MLKRIFMVIIILFLTIPLAAKVWVSPSFIELLISADKGKKYITGYTIGNNGKDKVKIILSCKNGTHFYKAGFLKLKPADNIPLISSWLEYNDSHEFFLESGQEKKLSFFVIPPDGNYSELSAVISFTVDEGQMIKSGLSVPLYTVIKENAEAKLAIESVCYSREKKVISVSLNNNSNIHLRPDVILEIRDVNGHRIRSIRIKEAAPIFMNGVIHYTESKDLQLKAGTYNAVLTVNYFFNKKNVNKEMKLTVNKNGEYIFQ